LVASRLHRPFVDSDVLIHAETGQTVRGLAAVGGEAAVRQAETQALREAFSRARPSVVAAAAGTVLDPNDRVHLQECLTVWLRAPARVLVGRAVGGGGEHRPFLDDELDPEEVLANMEHNRADLYRSVADLTLDASTATPLELADQICHWLEGRNVRRHRWPA
jgi:shikimate kinase